MNRANVLLALVAVLLLAVNLLPLQRGAEVICAPGTIPPHRATVLGLPFGFFATAGGSSRDNCAIVGSADAPVSTPGQRRVFTPASLWFDLILYGGIMLGAYFMLEWRTAK